jgi:prevent-host-death family protein
MKTRRLEPTVSVGIRELKNKLSAYLGKVKAGERLAVTDRGEVVAFIVPASESPELDGLLKLVREDRAAWNGGKPSGSESPVRIKGRAVSEIVLEDRR